jgi:hypothetical protein
MVVVFCIYNFISIGVSIGIADPGLFLYPVFVDYQNPDTYLCPGTQTLLSEDSYLSIVRELGEFAPTSEGIGKVFAWVRRNFAAYSAGGASIGKSEVNVLYEQKLLGGCHDWALLLSCVLRRYGYPVVMVDTAGIQWAMDFASNQTQSFSGHVFLEVFVENRWILMDSTTGEYIEAYDYHNPIIPITKPNEPIGYFVLFKGKDPADYGVTNVRLLNERMMRFSQCVETIPLRIPSCILGRF